MEYNFHILRAPRNEESAHIDQDLEDLEKPWLLGQGVRVGADFPSGSPWPLSRTWKGVRLNDFVSNKFGRLVVSERVRKILEAEPIEIEWLPIRLFDQKKREIQAPYFVANLVGTVECIDVERSEFSRSSAFPDSIFILRRLILDRARVPENTPLFRLNQMPQTLIVRADLVEKFQTAGVTGFSLLELGAPILI